MSLPIFDITHRAAEKIKSGYLWVFSNEMAGGIPKVEPGTWGWFRCAHDFIGTGYFNPHSLIGGRLLSREKRDDIEALLSSRLKESFARRQGLDLQSSSRLVFSEADFLPGFNLDYYSGVAVAQMNTAGMDVVRPVLENIIPSLFQDHFGRNLGSLVFRGDSSIRALEGIAPYMRVSRGDEEKLRRGSFKAEGISYAADFVSGQKTGFFLDQALNRRYVREWVKARPGLRVLDLFSYSGGWGLAALQAGAGHVTFVDESEKALTLIGQGLELNGVPKERAALVKADGFDFLEGCGDFFEGIVSDPPAFVKSKKNLPQALKAYEKLNRLCWRRLKDSGLLMSSSCSYHLSEEDFHLLLRKAVAKDGGFAHLVYRGRQAPDHPVLLSMPETSYLKCVGLMKLPS